MSIPFSISEFLILNETDVPLEVADKILKYHIEPLQAFRLASETPIWPSARSGYRSKEWERMQGREPGKDGRKEWSQHCFIGKGAVDWTTHDWNMLALFLWLESDACPYTRVAYYPKEQFFHCDYKAPEGEKQLFIGPQFSRASAEEIINDLVKKHY